MTDLSRREAIGIFGLAAVAGLTGCTSRDVEDAARKADEAARPYTPTFFTAAEWATVGLLADIVIPADDRSGSATDAGVPAFMDFMMTDVPTSQDRMREGLAWIDAESRRRHQLAFAELAGDQRLALVDAIAWPAQADESVKEGAEFFTYFRNLCASGFWSSRMGTEDLDYRGNVFNPGWNGCPEPQLRKLGVNYG